MPIEEVLPAGVGRVPKWWMEITPHYTLDEDDIVERRKAEDQMAFYYMQLAAADEAGVLLPDGTPKLGLDLKPLSWTPITPWNRTEGSGNNDASTGLGPGGRNFKPGHPVIDPKLFGIMENDPDYHSYLTGAKLPPGYFEKMGELAQSELGGTEGILNNLRQTDYGRYGRQAEAPAFKPAWAKKKLRSTETGGKIRQGEYNDSPNKFINQRRRVEPKEALPTLTTSTSSANLETTVSLPMNPMVNTPIVSINDQIKSLRIDNDMSTNLSVQQGATGDSPKNTNDDSPKTKKTMVRKVRKIRKTETTPTSAFVVDTPATTTPNIPNNVDVGNLQKQQAELALLKEQQEKLKRLQELQKQQQLLFEQQQKQQLVLDSSPAAPLDDDEISYEEEEIIEEDYIGDDYSEGSYEEEVILEDDDGDNAELGDLQAILAAKQAELQRLTQQLH